MTAAGAAALPQVSYAAQLKQDTTRQDNQAASSTGPTPVEPSAQQLGRSPRGKGAVEAAAQLQASATGLLEGMLHP